MSDASEPGHVPLDRSEIDRAELDRACLRNLLGSAPLLVSFKDLEGRYLHASEGIARLLGEADAAALRGKTSADVLGEREALNATADEQLVQRTGIPVVELHERFPREGGDRHQVTTKLPLRADDGALIGTIAISHDVTARRLIQEQVRAQASDAAAAADELAESHAQLRHVERELRTVLEVTPDPLSRFDRDLRYVYANPAAVRLSGGTLEELLGRTNRELGHAAEFVEPWEAALREVLRTGDGAEVSNELTTPDGLLYVESRMVAEFGPAGQVTGVLAVTRDLTTRRRAENALARQAVRDPLTGLANRVLLDDRINQALTRLQREPGRVAVLFLDIDRFKVVNDSLGHRAGDTLLIEVAERLSACARRSDTVARFGGDEFVILCEQLDDDDDTAAVADRFIEAFAEPFAYGGQLIHATSSMGIAMTSSPSALAEDLIRDADAAMYQAKSRQNSRGGYQFFDADVRQRAVTRMTLESELRRALVCHEFCLVYQPVHALDDGRLIGTEALLRWQHPVRGQVGPAEFMGVAEDSGVIVAIGLWVLGEALRQLAAWNAVRGDQEPLCMAVNISARQLSAMTLVHDVATALHETGVPPEQLCLEITETALLEDMITSAETLEKLSALGVRIALDDFGTGYSSLGHLRRFPVDIVKIDRVFVSGLTTRADDAAIVAAVTAMAHALGMTTVGEGVETADQMRELRRLGCDAGQGFLLAHPSPPDALRDLVLARVGHRVDAVHEAGAAR